LLIAALAAMVRVYSNTTFLPTFLPDAELSQWC
jgi:hypothetical protein